MGHEAAHRLGNKNLLEEFAGGGGDGGRRLRRRSTQSKPIKGAWEIRGIALEIEKLYGHNFHFNAGRWIDALGICDGWWLVVKVATAEAPSGLFGASKCYWLAGWLAWMEFDKHVRSPYLGWLVVRRLFPIYIRTCVGMSRCAVQRVK